MLNSTYSYETVVDRKEAMKWKIVNRPNELLPKSVLFPSLMSWNDLKLIMRIRLVTKFDELEILKPVKRILKSGLLGKKIYYSKTNSFTCLISSLRVCSTTAPGVALGFQISGAEIIHL